MVLKSVSAMTWWIVKCVVVSFLFTIKSRRLAEKSPKLFYDPGEKILGVQTGTPAPIAKGCKWTSLELQTTGRV